jgi:hypothetical protein
LLPPSLHLLGGGTITHLFEILCPPRRKVRLIPPHIRNANLILLHMKETSRLLRTRNGIDLGLLSLTKQSDG